MFRFEVADQQVAACCTGRRYGRRERRRFKNFSRNRPETTNLNHQYAIRRVDIDLSSDAGIVPGWNEA